MCHNLEYHAKRLIKEAEKIGISKEEIKRLKDYLHSEQKKNSSKV